MEAWPSAAARQQDRVVVVAVDEHHRHARLDGPGDHLVGPVLITMPIPGEHHLHTPSTTPSSLAPANTAAFPMTALRVEDWPVGD
jgi:hypothetical protein